MGYLHVYKLFSSRHVDSFSYKVNKYILRYMLSNINIYIMIA